MNATLSMRIVVLVCGMLACGSGAYAADVKIGAGNLFIEPVAFDESEALVLREKADAGPALETLVAGDDPDNPMARYLLSRALDFADIISFDVGIGASALPHVQVTRWCQLGFGARSHGRIAGGGTAFFEWKRQIGIYHENSWEFAFLPWTAEYLNRQGLGQVESYSHSHSGLNKPDEEIYTQRRDFWAIGADANLILDVLLEFHPVEFVDFFVGWFCADISEDDLLPEREWHTRL